MKVSVIIPFHRGEEYLRDCLDSLVVQTYSDIEVIVVNDHAPEDDLACLAEYENILNLKLYHLHDKTGVAAARNLGLDEAAGDYIFFLDSDDYLYENAIELLVTGAQERDDDITYGKETHRFKEACISKKAGRAGGGRSRRHRTGKKNRMKMILKHPD